MLLRERPYGLPALSGHKMAGCEPAPIAELFGCSRKRMTEERIELYDDGEYCEDVDDSGDTCLDRYDNTQCNPCMRRIENINKLSC